MSEGRRILVTGGRDYNDIETVRYAFGQLGVNSSDSIVQGGAKGADLLARMVAAGLGCGVETYKADWARYGKMAGPIRNQRMVDSAPDAVMQFPGGKGTADCVRKAREAGVPVFSFS